MRHFIHNFRDEIKKNYMLFLMISPAVIVVFMISYIPMSGIILAFKNYQFNLGIFKSPWTGFKNFEYFFRSGTGIRVSLNTVFFNMLNLITSQSLALLIALFLSELHTKIFKKVTQSVIFLPYFISWITVGAFVYNIFNYERGTLNYILSLVGKEPLNVYSIPWIWIVIICVFNAWKWVGYNSVVYIAAIAGVDTACYEAADLDGANLFQRIFHITLPSIIPMIVTIVLLNVGRIMRGDFQMFYQIIGNNGQLFNATDVIDTFVFRSLINNGDIGMTAAAGLYQSLLCFIIILTVNQITKKISEENTIF